MYETDIVKMSRQNKNLQKYATTEIVRNIIIAVYVISLPISANDLQDARLCYISLIGRCNGCMSTKWNKSTMYADVRMTSHVHSVMYTEHHRSISVKMYDKPKQCGKNID